MKSKSLILACILFAFLKSFTQDDRYTKLDSFFSRLINQNKAMGSFYVAKEGQVLYSNNFGYSIYSSDKKIASNEFSRYRIGSITKIFTATIIFQLIEENKLRLETTLESFFPGFPNAGEITIAQLLTHRSGIRNITDIDAKEQPRTEKEMLSIIAAKPPKYKPGTRSSYSNCNFLLLGYLVEKICNKPYAIVLKERITTSLGLSGTYYGNPGNKNDNESLPYKFVSDWQLQPQTDPSIPGASGAMVSTPKDLIIFIEALFTKKLVTENSLNQMKTVTNGYGMGFLEFEFDKKKALGYTGGIDEYESVLAYFPGEGLAIAYCSNGHDYPTRDIVMGAMNLFLGKKYSIPDFKESKSGHHALKKYTGKYTSRGFPVHIQVIRQGNQLVAESPGYLSYTLQPVGSGKFKCTDTSVAIEFNTRNNSMKVTWNGIIYNFKK